MEIWAVAKKLKSKYTDRVLLRYHKTFCIFGIIIELFGLFFLLFDIIFASIFIILGIFYIYLSIFYKKVAKGEIATERKNNLVTTTKGDKIFWKPTTIINEYLEIDDLHETVAIFERNIFNKFHLAHKINYTDILSFELQENTKTVITSNSGLSNILSNQFLFGEDTGAIVASNMASKEIRKLIQSLRIEINLKSISEEPIHIEFINNSLMLKYSIAKAEEIVNALARIQNKAMEMDDNPYSSDLSNSADEIRKYKALLDDGIITANEYEAKKKQLLNI